MIDEYQSVLKWDEVLRGRLDNELSQNLHNAIDYIDTDPASSLTKSRVILEDLLKRLYIHLLKASPPKPMIGPMLADQQFAQHLPRRILARMNTIRDMANLGAHQEEITRSDAIRVLKDVIDVLDWFVKTYRLSLWTNNKDRIQRCLFCGREFLDALALREHEQRCPLNRLFVKLHIWNDAGTQFIEIPLKIQDRDFRLRSLRSLVDSVPDSFRLRRAGDHIVMRSGDFGDVPWYQDVEELIVKYFMPELLQYIPEGDWHIGLIHPLPTDALDEYDAT